MEMALVAAQESSSTSSRELRGSWAAESSAQGNRETSTLPQVGETARVKSRSG